MAASLEYRQQEDGLGMAVMKEEDDGDDLKLFFEMQNHEKETTEFLFENFDEFDNQLGPEPDTSQITKVPSALPAQKANADCFLDFENQKTDYNWLLAPPSSLEVEPQKPVMSQIEISNAHPTALKSRPSDPTADTAPSGCVALPTSTKSSTAGNRRPTSSGGRASTASRPATPTRRTILPLTAKTARSSTPTSRTTVPSNKPTAPPTRSSTPTRLAPRSSTPTRLAPRSSTPTRSAPRSSTPTARPALALSSKPISRSKTPTFRPSIQSSTPTTSAPVLKSSMPSRGKSPTIKSRPLKPSDMPGVSLDATPNLRRPASASRSRPVVPSTQSSSVQTTASGKQRRPSTRTSQNGGNSNGSAWPAISRAHSTNSDDVSPVEMGNKMVERVVNMRKLAPPKQDDHLSGDGRSMSQNNSGFGRSLSKKSLDMAMRHMDIRRSMPGDLRPLTTKVAASSVYSVRSESTRAGSVLDSPLGTSSNASSELSVNNNGAVDED